MTPKLVSGGQTGVDRVALDFARSQNLPHGGWCPFGRRAEDGTIPASFVLRETPSDDPAQRTEWNVRDSDGTVILSAGSVLTGGGGIRPAGAGRGIPAGPGSRARSGGHASGRCLLAPRPAVTTICPQ